MRSDGAALNQSVPATHNFSPLPLKLLVSDQPFHQRRVSNPVMATDQKGI